MEYFNNKINIICKKCGKFFHPRYSLKKPPVFCSMECYLSHRWGVRKTKHNCIVCGCEFFDYPSNKRKYCSRKCYDKSTTRGTRPRNRHRVKCTFCGEYFERVNSNFRSHCKNHFCSQGCFGKWWAENCLRGEDNPNWQGGYCPEEYSAGWNALKKTVRDRANGVCEVCGKTHKLMDVHHLIPVRLKNDITVTNHIDNLQYLCRPCHIDADKILRGGYPHQKDLIVADAEQDVQ